MLNVNVSVGLNQEYIAQLVAVLIQKFDFPVLHCEGTAVALDHFEIFIAHIGVRVDAACCIVRQCD